MYNKIILILSLSILTFFILKKNNEQFVNFDSITNNNKQALDNLNSLAVSLYNKDTKTSNSSPLNLISIKVNDDDKIEKLNVLYRNKYCNFCTEKSKSICNGCQTCDDIAPLQPKKYNSSDIMSSAHRWEDPCFGPFMDCKIESLSPESQCLGEIDNCNKTLKHCKSLSFNELIASFDNPPEITLPKLKFGKTKDSKYNSWMVPYSNPVFKKRLSCLKLSGMDESEYNKYKTSCKNNYKSASYFKKRYDNKYDSGCAVGSELKFSCCAKRDFDHVKRDNCSKKIR